jgi:uncharacterized protein with FMN-binding domain
MKRQARIALMVVPSVLVGLGLVVLLAAMSFGIPRQDYTVNEVDFSRVADGSYTGEYRIVPPFGTFAVFKRVKVQVEMAGGRVRRITVLSPEAAREQLAPLAEEVVARQSLSFDAVTAGTWTTTAMLKAVETAVRGR